MQTERPSDTISPEAAPEIDWASSPTLTRIREVAGEEAVRKLIAARGGCQLYLPEKVTPDCCLTSIVGLHAARKIVDSMGSHTRIDVPTGRGHRHGRRIDHAEVRRLWGEGVTTTAIARQVGCTSRHVHNIVSGDRPARRSAGRSLGSGARNEP